MDCQVVWHALTGHVGWHDQECPVQVSLVGLARSVRECREKACHKGRLVEGSGCAGSSIGSGRRRGGLFCRGLSLGQGGRALTCSVQARPVSGDGKNESGWGCQLG